MIVHGVQPVLEALEGGASIRRIVIARGGGRATQKIRAQANRRGVEVTESSKKALVALAGTERHQGVVAELDAELRDVDLDTILEAARREGTPPLVVLLDGIQDPHNLGALLRSAWALGAHGVVLPNRRAAPVNATAIKASAGAALHVPIATVTNLKSAVDALREAEVWTAAAVLGGDPLDGARLDGPLGLVIGGEGKGVRPTLAARCDMQVHIPLARSFDSLNASVAGGILLYETARQRRVAARDPRVSTCGDSGS